MKKFKKRKILLFTSLIISAFCYFYLNMQSNEGHIFSFFNAELFNNASSVEKSISFPEIAIMKALAEKILALFTTSIA